MRLIGLTGGIGSGKSTVAAMIRELGVAVLDADEIARAITQPGLAAHADIAVAWPDVVPASGGPIDRKKLAAHVFADPVARARLEAITHPRIHERALAMTADLARQGHTLVFYEASLLVETKRQGEFDGLVVVTAPEQAQITRTIARDGCTEAEARARLAAQTPLPEKLRFATDVIDNADDLVATRRQVDALVEKWRKTAAT